MLRQAVIDAIQKAIPGFHGDLDRFLSEPPNPALGDIAFGCFGIAPVLNLSPADAAKKLATEIILGDLIESVRVFGPYLNFRANAPLLLQKSLLKMGSGYFEKHPSQKVMIEFSQPNTHKPFHVGHLRNVVIGDSLVRLNRAYGNEVLAANYFGDFGIDVAKCLWCVNKHFDLLPKMTSRSSWLGAAYILANQILIDDEAAFNEVREVLHQMENKDPAIWGQYYETRQWCLQDFKDIYSWLNVKFDVEFFESEVDAAGTVLVNDYLKSGVFEESDGAIICQLEPKINTPALVRKSDGTNLYLTWDLALAKQKFEQFDIERSLYVVGSEQQFHFSQLFATLEKMGYQRAADCEHISYELVVLPNGKMSSRNGTAIPFYDLKNKLYQAVKERLKQNKTNYQDEEETIHRIAVACLKYGMVKISKNKPVVFEINDWVNFEGDTGAYLLYSVARIRSILRKANQEIDLNLDPDNGFGDFVEEHVLLNQLLKASFILENAVAKSEPAALASWLYDSARAISKFYNACPVINVEPSLSNSRLALLKFADFIMTWGLDLIGIETVDIM